MSAFSRYSFVSSRTDDEGRSFKSTTKMNARIRRAVVDSEIRVSVHTLQEGERLDTLAFRYFNSSEYWWVIAAASGIGWNLQLPPGTLLQVPNSLSDVMRYLR